MSTAAVYLVGVEPMPQATSPGTVQEYNQTLPVESSEAVASDEEAARESTATDVHADGTEAGQVNGDQEADSAPSTAPEPNSSDQASAPVAIEGAATPEATEGTVAPTTDTPAPDEKPKEEKEPKGPNPNANPRATDKSKPK